MLDLFFLITACIIFFIAGVIKGIVGIAFPAVILGIMSIYLEPRFVVGLLLVPMILTNFRQGIRGGRIGQILKKQWRLFLVASIFTFFASYFAGYVSERILLLVAGGGILAFAFVSLLNSPPHITDYYEKPAQIITGIVVGTLGGLAAIVGPTMAIYMMGRRLERDIFVQTGGLVFLASSLLLGLGMLLSGEMTHSLFMQSIALVPFTFLGLFIGEKLRNRFDRERFYKLILFGFIFIGLNLVRKGIVGG